jgi:hypothetical protein
VFQHIDQDPSLASLRDLYEQDHAEPEFGIINVVGLKCVGVPIGTPEFVNAFVRFKANAIEQDVQKLRIVHGPNIHCDLLRFCQHSLGRNVPPDAMMRPADVNFD